MVVEAMRAAESLKDYDIGAEIIDMRSVSDLDIATVTESVSKIGKLLVVDCACEVASVGHTIISRMSQEDPAIFKHPPQLLAWPNHPVPTSTFQAKDYYPEHNQILASILNVYGVVPENMHEAPANIMDIPNRDFVGPF
jgi:pyruvate dehydrogenase E1 component beta subunit